MNQLSKSVMIMFLFDFTALTLVSYFWSNYFNLPHYITLSVIFITVLSGLVVLFLKGNYKIREFNITGKNTYLLFEGLVFAHVPTSIILLFGYFNLDSLKFLFFNLLTTFVILRIYRAIYHIYLFYFKKTKNVLIIGTAQNAKVIADEIINKKALKMNVVGLFEDKERQEDIINDVSVPVFRQPANLKQIIKDNNVDIVIVATRSRMQEFFLSEMVFEIPNHVKVYKMPVFYEMITGKCYVDKMTTNWLFYDYMNRRSVVYDFCKRAFDIIAATIILTVTFPILLYIGIRVKKIDGGNAIYTQNRAGKGGKLFKAYKLRTMYANDYVPKAGQKIEYAENQNVDDRVIPFCRFVRKARLDEIPQMINILKGEMSIVGPRTEWEEVVNIYRKEVPYYPCRMWVKTGWTGWAQINQGHCFSSDDESEKLAYDLYYLKHRNVLWEICILVKAVFLAIGGRHG